MTKLRLLIVLFVCAVLPYAAPAVVRPTVPLPAANQTAAVSNSTALPPVVTELLNVYRQGFQEGTDFGTQRGFDQGYKQGHEQGNKTGHTAGWSEGFDFGYDLGKSSGYSRGQLDAYWNVFGFVFFEIGILITLCVLCKCCGKKIGQDCIDCASA
ncbi:hypothetical protein M3Y99_00644500 [Aphelenchoides fujianensis]|nr:hypothetical protein M3Y99_00644500 [Aphelenchoides fujianensis]